MPRAIEVFTPNSVPTFTYVERTTHKFEERLREAFSIPNMIISVSGPSKSGKTVLINKIIEPENLIPISGATIKTADDLWALVLGWMETPTSRTEKKGATIKGEVGGRAGGKFGIPFLAEGKVDGEGKIGAERKGETEETYSTTGLDQVIDDIGKSTFTVFVDDFHYIPKAVQKEIGRQIKAAAESGVRICTASVPHRSDDVVRSNPELRGRVTAIDVDRWKEESWSKLHTGGSGN
jgi:hypothetical protein